MEGNPNEDVLVLPEDVDLVKEQSAAMGEVKVTPKFKNPRPYQKNYFVLKSGDRMNTNVLHFRCVMWHPKITIIIGQMKRLYNLESCVYRMHLSYVTQFDHHLILACYTVLESYMLRLNNIEISGLGLLIRVLAPKY